MLKDIMHLNKHGGKMDKDLYKLLITAFICPTAVAIVCALFGFILLAIDKNANPFIFFHEMKGYFYVFGAAFFIFLGKFVK